MIPEELALQTLTADSAYCLAVGAGTAVMSPKVAKLLDLPTPLVAATGLASLGWGGWVGLAAGSGDWRAASKVVVGADALGAASLAAVAATRPTRGARIATAAVALQVAGFAGVLGTALLWDRKSHIGTTPEPPGDELPIERDDLAG